MIIKYNLINDNFKKYNNKNFILRHNNGDFCFFSYPNNISKYNGYYCVRKNNNFEWDMIKSIETIEIDAKIISSKKEKNYFINEYENNKNNKDYNKKIIEKIGLSENLNYSIKNYDGNIRIILDSRMIHDFSTEGRIYKIYKLKNNNQNLIVIQYTKYINNSLKDEIQNIYTVIKGINKFKEEKKWIKKEYRYDKRRESGPYEMYVYYAINIIIENNISLNIATSENINEAIKRVNKNFKQINFNNKLIDNEINLAYEHAKNAINQSIVSINFDNVNKKIIKGIYAGLPWFYQFWTRDQAISLYGAYLSNKSNIQEIKDILINLILNISDDGRISNRVPSSILGSADGIGWVFKRINDLLNFFNENEKIIIKEKIIESIKKIELNYMDNNLITNKAKETWMDTEFKGDIRKGKRIEIQTLHLNMLNLASNLCNEKEYYNKEQLMKKTLKNEFFENNLLADGKNDFTIRPNIFLAYYTYKDFLNNKEWELIFDNTIKKLWLNWGGFSTIDLNSNLFHKYHTGQNNNSYHRGDSWYFINNIAAICLLKLNYKKYKYYIEKIINSSKYDILNLGAIGELSEISSSNIQEPFGCFGQAWSSATFVELINLKKLLKNKQKDF
jgi:glycogen debranching enzyme